MATTRDEFGVTRITLETARSLNRPGQLVVDGDTYEIGRCVSLVFELESEPAETLEEMQQESEIHFGTFSLSLRGSGKMSGGVLLTSEQVEDLIAALRFQIEPEEDA